MKKTYFITMITAALMGSAYANTDYSATPGTHCSPPDDVYGTYADTGEASGGSVEVFEVSAPEGYEYLDYVHGGYVHDSGDATENAVTINDGYVYNNVYGGYVGGDGDATGNAVTMTGGEVGYYVLGCYVKTGNATGNTVNMAGGEVGVEVNGGYVAGDGNATGNTVTIAGGEVGTVVAGGYVDDSGDATGNTVTITGGEVGDDVYGGYVDDSGVATDNTVTMTGGQVGSDVYGGYVHDTGNATDNTVTMSGGEVYGEVYGGYVADSGDATGNAVTINDGYVAFSVNGGYVYDTGNASDNTVTMNGGEVHYSVYGGYTCSGNVSGNTVTMSGGEVARLVCGGYVDNSGDATDNTVDMTGGEVGIAVYGGRTYSGNVTGNTVTMTGGRVGDQVYGGCVDNSGDATGNTVTMTGGYVGDEVYGGYTSSGNAIGNTVTMAGGEVEKDIHGGYAQSGAATGNTVNISGGSARNVHGGLSKTEDGCAENNSVLMTGGKADIVTGGVAGGSASNNTVVLTDGEVKTLACGESVFGNANGNTVIMTGGQVDDYVFGGYTESGNASGNAIHLVGEGASYTIGKTSYKGGNIAIQGNVRAGYVVDGGVSSNNSVHVYGKGVTIGGTIDSCQMLTFHLAQGQADGGAAPMVTLGGALDLEGVELGFNGDAVTDWAAFNGKSITLVSMTNETITGLVPPTDPVDITDEAGETVATSTLELSEDGKALTLTNIQGVTPVPPPPPPVPTVGPDALDVTLVNSLWASSAYVREFVRLAESQGYALKEGDTAVWGGGFGTFMHATGNRGFKSDGGGYGIGVNHAFSANTQAGISLGQGFGSYHNSGADGATVHQRAILAAATASTRIGKDFSLGGHLAFGNVRNRADCHLDGAPTERARWNDNVFNLGAQAAYDFHVTERTAITPFLGLDWMNGAHESFTGGYARHYSHGRLNELRMPVGVTVSTATEVGSTKLLPQLSVAYVPSLAQQVPHANVSSENGNYRVKGYAPGRNAFMLNVGVNAVFSDSWSAGAFYTLETRSHCVDQSVNASVRYTF